jgi:hypothetical protein
MDEGKMTRPLRRAHLRTWLVLALALYAIFAAGLAARREPTPRNQSLHWEQYR